MKTKFLLSIMALGLTVSAFGQNTLELNFTAKHKGQYVPLDSIFIENLTQGGDTALYSPDSVLVLYYITGIDGNQAIAGNTFSLSQNYPNPFKGQTTIDLNLPEAEQIEITIRDIVGRELVRYTNTLTSGNHSFAFYPGNEICYLLTATGKQKSQTIKMLNALSNASNGEKCKLAYLGNNADVSDYKSHGAINDFVFAIGDSLRYNGYALTMDGIKGNNEIVDAPTLNTNYEFAILKGLRCPGIPTITDIDGNLYNTVQIGTQCWMKENLKTTTYDNGEPILNVTGGSNWQTNISGAYVWYDNDISWKDLYGAMYNWYAGNNLNGLCPQGWHVPSYDEWTAFVDHIGGVGSPHGNELKFCRQVNSPLGGECNTSAHPRWDQDNTNFGTDIYGFSGLPGGNRSLTLNGVTFSALGVRGHWWTSTGSGLNAGFYYLAAAAGNVNGAFVERHNGYSVRCLKDETSTGAPSVQTGTVSNISTSSADIEGEIIDIGSSDIIQHGHCWSTAPDPTLDDSKTELGTSGIGSFTSNLSDLEAGTVYYVKAYATNSIGTAYGLEISFETATSSGDCPSTLSDIDGNEYNTVQIGDQCWMQENLKTTTYQNGEPIPNITDAGSWINLTSGAYAWQYNNITWKGPYGALYNGHAVVDINGLCPPDWHVPSKDEWTILTDFIGGTTSPH